MEKTPDQAMEQNLIQQLGANGLFIARQVARIQELENLVAERDKEIAELKGKA